MRSFIALFSTLKKNHSKSNIQAGLHALLILLLVLGNHFQQIFCVPTVWSSFILWPVALRFTFLAYSPTSKTLQAFLSFLDGIALFVCLYCILFMEWASLFALALIPVFGIGILIAVPQYFGFLLLRNQWKQPGVTANRMAFFFSFALCLLTSVLVGWQFQIEGQRIHIALQENTPLERKSILTEKILGMHFIYHTQIDYYDGWRPPIHDPLVVIGYNLNQRKDLLKLELKERIALYRKVFPSRPIKMKCSCARAYRSNYFEDPLWLLFEP